ncbi:MAG TPA: Bax inhibitor-1/YccA family protein [Balneolaceae bacterium]|nr:Bax inhibitor-1/YccA family protein [Balneolaceae bacterium]
MFRSGNPTLSEEVFTQQGRAITRGEQMTVTGTVNKIGILFLLLLCGATISWFNPSGAFIGIGAFGGFIVAMVTVFKREWSPVTAPIYALCEGLFLGAISLAFSHQYQGIIFNAVSLTLGIFGAMFLIYRSGMIEVTHKFRMGVAAATGGIFLVFLAGFILRLFGINLSLVYGTGVWGIGFSLIIVGIAALNLVLDFDLIEKGAAAGAPQYFEWYTAFGLIVTLVWLYIEILRLLSLAQRR